jgi:hypothetical protein
MHINATFTTALTRSGQKETSRFTPGVPAKEAKSVVLQHPVRLTTSLDAPLIAVFRELLQQLFVSALLWSRSGARGALSATVW